MVARIICGLSIAACASAPRNPMLDKYPAGISGRTTIVYYDVHGRTLDELRSDLRRLGPKVDGSSFVGETRSPMRWTWRTESLGGASCSIREVSVFVNAQITLPRWVPPADAEPGLVDEWKRFLAALETHESGHKDISAKAGREISERLRSVSGLCSQLGTRANDLARAVVERAKAEQIAYDRTTRHGLTQGTGFGAGRIAGDAHAPLRLVVGPRAGTIRASLPVTIDQAWATLGAAYTASGLIINAADSGSHVAGDSLTVLGTLGNTPVSQLVGCGTPPLGRNADSVSIALFVTSRLEASQPTVTTMTNTVQAVARAPGTEAIACRSRGTLERRILEAMLARFAR